MNIDYDHQVVFSITLMTFSIFGYPYMHIKIPLFFEGEGEIRMVESSIHTFCFLSLWLISFQWLRNKAA